MNHNQFMLLSIDKKITVCNENMQNIFYGLQIISQDLTTNIFVSCFVLLKLMLKYL